MEYSTVFVSVVLIGGGSRKQIECCDNIGLRRPQVPKTFSMGFDAARGNEGNGNRSPGWARPTTRYPADFVPCDEGCELHPLRKGIRVHHGVITNKACRYAHEQVPCTAPRCELWESFSLLPMVSIIANEGSMHRCKGLRKPSDASQLATHSGIVPRRVFTGNIAFHRREFRSPYSRQSVNRSKHWSLRASEQTSCRLKERRSLVNRIET